MAHADYADAVTHAPPGGHPPGTEDAMSNRMTVAGERFVPSLGRKLTEQAADIEGIWRNCHGDPNDPQWLRSDLTPTASTPAGFAWAGQ